MQRSFASRQANLLPPSTSGSRRRFFPQQHLQCGRRVRTGSLTLLVAVVAIFAGLVSSGRSADSQATQVPLTWLGPPRDESVTDVVTADSPLVGMDVWVGTRSFEDGSPLITAVSPIYGGAHPHKSGPFGHPSERPIRIEAEQGYAVAGVRGRATDRILGFRLVFMRVRDGKFDPSDQYEGRWVGGRGQGTAEVTIAADGRPILGLICRVDYFLNALTLAYDARQLNQPKPQVAQSYSVQQIIGEVERRGGQVVRDPNSPDHPITEIDLRNCQLRDAGLAYLRGLTSLKRLDLSNGYNIFTKNGVANLATLTNLEQISIRKNFGSAQQLPLYLRELPHLKSLELAGSNDGNQNPDAAILGSMTGLEKLTISDAFGDAAMEHLARLTNLRELYIDATPITDIGAERFRNFRKLRSLTVYTGVIDDDGFASLEDLHELEQLTLGGRELTAAVLKHVQAPKLRALTLSGGQFDDDAVAYLKEMTNLEELHLLGTRLTDKGLAGLKSLKRLIILDLPDGSLSGAGLHELTDLKQLRSLKLARNQIEGSALAAIRNFPALEVLDLTSTQVTGESLADLKNATKLRELSLGGVRLLDESLAQLEPLTNLEVLLLPATHINGSGLPHLKPLTKLWHLQLQVNPISDKKATALGELASLRHLNLEQTKIGDATIAAVAKLPKLEVLQIPFTEVTNDGVQQLASATTLRELNLSNQRLTGAIIAPLLGLKELRILAINMTQTNDAEFSRLAELPQLRTLYVGATRVSDDAIHRIQAKSLKVKIFRRYPQEPEHRP
jgi:Leucine-rich repeat (LRR) protein